MYSQQNYSFWRFAPYVALVFHILFITHRPIQMKYPQKQLEVQNKIIFLSSLINFNYRCKINYVQIQQQFKPC
jgi:hypothetical protein